MNGCVRGCGTIRIVPCLTVALILVRLVVTTCCISEGSGLRKLPSMCSFGVLNVGRIVVTGCGLTLRHLTWCRNEKQVTPDREKGTDPGSLT